MPEFLAFAVTNLLEQHFGRLVDYEFTALMEDDLDRIAVGRRGAHRLAAALLLRRGRRRGPEGARRATSARSTRARSTRSRSATASTCASAATARTSSAATSAQTLRRDRARRADARAGRGAPRPGPSGARARRRPRDRPHGRACETGRYGPYVTEVAEGDEKPRTASLFKSMSPETVTLEEALPLLALPRASGRVRTARRSSSRTAATARSSSRARTRGRSRPRSSSSRSRSTRRSRCSPSRKQRGRRAAAPPLKELGDDPVSGKPIVVKDGRFGPYVTDGETNASLRAGRLGRDARRSSGRSS